MVSNPRHERAGKPDDRSGRRRNGGHNSRLPGSLSEKGTGTFCRNGPPGASHKRCLFPFPPERNCLLAVCGLLTLAVALVFGQTLRHGFIDLDDGPCVYENPSVADGLTARGAAWAFTLCHVGNWAPLCWISHMLDCQFYGRGAGGHHLTNVILHAATAVLFFLVLWRMTGRAWPPALAAVLFAIHPLRVESVAWIAERKDVLSGLFFMLTLGAYVSYVRQRQEGEGRELFRTPVSVWKSLPARPSPPALGRCT